MQVEFKHLQLFQIKATSLLKTKQLFGCVVDFQGAKSQTPGVKTAARTSAQPGTEFTFSPFIEFLIVLIFIYVIL